MERAYYQKVINEEPKQNFYTKESIVHRIRHTCSWNCSTHYRPQQSPTLWQSFQCGYDLGLNNSSLTRDQTSEYCNNQILKIENVEKEEDDLTTVGFWYNSHSHRIDNNRHL